jgi:hypothetical protein
VSPGVIWICLWVGFAILMRGGSNDPELYNPASNCTFEDDTSTKCWRSWFGSPHHGAFCSLAACLAVCLTACLAARRFLIKVFYQSMGEFLNQDIQTDAELAVRSLAVVAA